ncbi:hypothetical protein ACFXPS_25980 [Nocardia sp. NPDC059091]|uniref:hypothetical protein n=1 Tax=unclassified Nocardia TaxID=2637762 RepID=UPI0036B77F15
MTEQVLAAACSLSSRTRRFASICGNSEALRRAFIARLGIPPRKYQQRFRTTGSPAAARSEETEPAVS